MLDLGIVSIALAVIRIDSTVRTSLDITIIFMVKGLLGILPFFTSGGYGRA